MIDTAILHALILDHIIKKGYAPTVNKLADLLQSNGKEMTQALLKLQSDHGVVLHPHKPEIWVIHPFSLAPTNFYVQSARGEWWGNCAWCSFGVAALLKEDVTITTVLGGEHQQIVIAIEDGELQDKEYIVHFPIPMENAWDNVVFTCSNMLIFENESQIDQWSKKHAMPKGDFQPVEKVWQFAQRWYGNHLRPDWKKWTIEEAKSIFKEFDLTHRVWQLQESDDRF